MTISRTQAATLITESNGKIFTATVTKKDGKSRKMNCRLHVKKGVKGKTKTPNIGLLGMVKVYDMQEKGYRTLNLPNVTELRINKSSYTVR